MPTDLPGLYYDPEKNRYFPLKGPIPGSSRARSASSSASSQDPVSKSIQVSTCRKPGRRPTKLLQARELSGNVIASGKGKFNFQEEYQKAQVCQPMVWKYEGTDRIADAALESIQVNLQTPEGQTETEALLTGGVNGSLCLFETGKVGHRFNNLIKCIPDCVRPPTSEDQPECSMKAPGYIWRSTAALQMSSNISSITNSSRTFDGGFRFQNAMITTLGSETYGGSVYLLNLMEPLNLDQSLDPLRQRLYKIALLKCTIWTGDYNSDSRRAVIGTNMGAALVNLETGVPSWVCQCKSDVLSLQLGHSGNTVICGLRNGAIVTVDIRERKREFSDRFTKHRIPYPSHRNSEPQSRASAARKYNNKWLELKGKIYPSRTVFMPSSISCLVSLRLYDQYFLGGSMDGLINLYDHRLLKRGPVQSYEGHVNTHSHIQLGVDSSERFVLSGGEDKYTRIWSIKSGELLFKNKFSDAVPTAVCWNRYNESWLGSQGGLFCMRWS